MAKSLPEEIVRLEWEMFSAVSNVGGQASCQRDPDTFAIMRRSQAESWPEDVQESWLGDLEEAKRNGRNLMSEKYAWMMESTFPREFLRIADRLPRIDEKTLALIEEIVSANVAWKLETAEKYPRLNGQGRAVRTAEDSPWSTSFETYLRGELKTYSPETLRRLHRHTRQLLKEGINGAERTLLNQSKRYGYASLAAAEQALSRPRRDS